MLTDEMRYKLMRVLEAHPEISQRALARELGVSLGKVNYCLQALVKKGLVKAKNFSNSDNKAAYAYLLTGRGVKQRMHLTGRYLKAKMKEYDELRVEIERTQREVDAMRKA